MSDAYLKDRYFGQSTISGIDGNSSNASPLNSNDLILEVLKPAPEKLIYNTKGSSVKNEPAVLEKAIPVRTPQEVAEYYGISLPEQGIQAPVVAQPTQYSQQEQQTQRQPQPSKANPPVFKTVKDVLLFQPKTGDEYELKRKAIEDIRNKHLQNYRHQLASQGADIDTIQKYIKDANDSLDMQGFSKIPEYDKTEEYKAIKEEFGSAIKNDSTLTRKFAEAIKSADEALARGDRSTAFSIMQSQLPKQIQSISTGSPDALQGPEFDRLTLALQTVYNTSPSQWASIVNGKGFADAFKSQPEKFLQFAKIVHDANVNVLNQKREFAESVLGKKYSAGVVGSIAGHQKFNELEKVDSDPTRQRIYSILNDPQISTQVKQNAKATLVKLYGGK